MREFDHEAWSGLFECLETGYICCELFGDRLTQFFVFEREEFLLEWDRVLDGETVVGRIGRYNREAMALHNSSYAHVDRSCPDTEVHYVAEIRVPVGPSWQDRIRTRVDRAESEAERLYRDHARGEPSQFFDYYRECRPSEVTAVFAVPRPAKEVLES